MDWWFYLIVACIAFYMVNVLILLGRLKDQGVKQERHASRLVELLEILVEREEVNPYARPAYRSPSPKAQENTSRLEG